MAPILQVNVYRLLVGRKIQIINGNGTSVMCHRNSSRTTVQLKKPGPRRSNGRL